MKNEDMIRKEHILVIGIIFGISIGMLIGIVMSTMCSNSDKIDNKLSVCFATCSNLGNDILQNHNDRTWIVEDCTDSCQYFNIKHFRPVFCGSRE